MKRFTLILFLAALTLAGCSFIPTYERPQAPVASAWPTGKAEAPVASSTAWEDFVQAPRLRELLRLALDNNRDLRVATLNIEQVRAQYRIQRASLFPSVTGGVTATPGLARACGPDLGFRRLAPMAKQLPGTHDRAPRWN